MNQRLPIPEQRGAPEGPNSSHFVGPRNLGLCCPHTEEPTHFLLQVARGLASQEENSCEA